MTKWSRKPPKIAALGPVGRKGIIIMKHLAEGAIREKISSNLRLAVVQNNFGNHEHRFVAHVLAFSCRACGKAACEFWDRESSHDEIG